jgi:hypothetical protein
MPIHYVCSRCGNIGKVEKDLKKITLRKIMLVWDGYETHEIMQIVDTWDLCKRCDGELSDAFRSFMEQWIAEGRRQP